MGSLYFEGQSLQTIWGALKSCWIFSLPGWKIGSDVTRSKSALEINSSAADDMMRQILVSSLSTFEQSLWHGISHRKKLVEIKAVQQEHFKSDLKFV